ncbi:MAG: restriction endonuclease subunit S, partial [Acetobacter sp.]|nr:restriction endonuclease subunit S [Acetobacter sp.]
LDLFTELTAELTAELELRKKQYAYYREVLLSFDEKSPSVIKEMTKRLCPNGIEYKTIKEVSRKTCSGGTPNSSNRDYYKGDIPWLRTQEVDFNEIYETELKISEDALKNSSAKWIPANCVIVAMYGATAAKVAINRIPLTTNQACCNLEIDANKAHYKYVYYCLCNQYEDLKAKGRGTQSNINKAIVEQQIIPLPPLEIQHKIVEILDKFDTLTTSLTEGIPAEIEARRKQYTYYRNKLLTFKELAPSPKE